MNKYILLLLWSTRIVAHLWFFKSFKLDILIAFLSFVVLIDLIKIETKQKHNENECRQICDRVRSSAQYEMKSNRLISDFESSVLLDPPDYGMTTTTGYTVFFTLELENLKFLRDQSKRMPFLVNMNRWISISSHLILSKSKNKSFAIKWWRWEYILEPVPNR